MSQSTSAQLGVAVRLLRKSREWSIEELAAKAGLHWTSVSRIENGRQNPGWEAVVSLATALDVDLGDLGRLAAEQPPSGR